MAAGLAIVAGSVLTTAVAAHAGAGDCSTIWYVSQAGAPGGNGTFGTVDPGAGTWTPTGSLSEPSSALAVAPGGLVAYYLGWDPIAGPDGRLFRLDLSSGASALLATHRMFDSVRLAMDRDGTLWTLTVDGHLWSTAPGDTQPGSPLDHGLLRTSGAGASALVGGDLAADGLGNLWIVAGSELFTISAADLSGGRPQAGWVGALDRQNVPGIAFGPGGTLYSTTGGTSAALSAVDPATGRTTVVSPTGPASVGDLGSCAAPRPALDQTTAVTPTRGVAAGAVLTYSIAVHNRGDAAATGALMRDAIPDHTAYVPGSTRLDGTPVADDATGFPYSAWRELHSPHAGGGLIDAGTTALLTYQVRVSSPLPPGVAGIANQAFVSFAGGGPAAPTDDPRTPPPADPTVVAVAVAVVRADLSLDAFARLSHDTDHDRLAGVGDTVTFAFVVRNTGTVPLTGVAISEQLLAPAGHGVGLSCPRTTLASGQAMTCSSSAYAVTQADVDAGAVTLRATAQGRPPVGRSVHSTPDETVTRAAQHAGITLTRSADLRDSNHNGAADAGESLRYIVRIQNTGTTTLTRVDAADPTLEELAIRLRCPLHALRPGAAMTCTTDTVIVRAPDLQAGRLPNVATFAGSPSPGGTGAVTQVSGSGTVVAAAEGSDGRLALTGNDPAGLIYTALGLLALGACLIRVNPRRGPAFPRSERRPPAVP